MLNNKDIEFLSDLEIKLQHQSYMIVNGIKPTSKDLITPDDFEKFYKVVDKLYKSRERNRQAARQKMAEKRKIDKTYGRPYSYKIKVKGDK